MIRSDGAEGIYDLRRGSLSCSVLISACLSSGSFFGSFSVSSVAVVLGGCAGVADAL